MIAWLKKKLASWFGVPTVRCKFMCKVVQAADGAYIQGAKVVFTDVTYGTTIGSGATGPTGYFQVTAHGTEGQEYLYAYIFPPAGETPPAFQVEAGGRGYEGRMDNLTHTGTVSEPKPGGGFVEFEL